MEDLAKENIRLQSELDRLLLKVSESQHSLERFQAYELEVLSCQSLNSLLQKLLIDSQDSFDLAACRFIWWDPQDVVSELLEFEELQSFGGTLEFVHSDQVLNSLFRSGLQPQLKVLCEADQVRWFPWEPNVKSCILLPLVREGRIFGSLHLGSVSAERFSPGKSVDFMQRLAAVISLCLEGCVNHEHLRRLSMIDRLTRVKNRRSFDQNLSQELSRAIRTEKPLSCLFIDLDHFKSVNDSHGHQAGDAALKSIAEVISQQLRDTDHLARYGGEEFAVLLPDCNRAKAIDIAERIRMAAEEFRISFEGSDRFRVTLSVGVSTWFPGANAKAKNLDESSGIDLVARADKAVYEAKRLGRNQVCYKPFEKRSKSVWASKEPEKNIGLQINH